MEVCFAQSSGDCCKYLQFGYKEGVIYGGYRTGGCESIRLFLSDGQDAGGLLAFVVRYLPAWSLLCSFPASINRPIPGASVTTITIQLIKLNGLKSSWTPVNPSFIQTPIVPTKINVRQYLICDDMTHSLRRINAIGYNIYRAIHKTQKSFRFC